MSILPFISDLRERMDKCLKAVQADLMKIRTGRASLSLIDGIKIDYYGALSPLSQVATLGVPEARLITIVPWDTKMIPIIEKAILKADIGLMPSNDGKMIRLPVPALTEERRREFVKMVKKMVEEGRIALRHVRRDAMEQLKKEEKESLISKDDHQQRAEEVEKVTHEYVEKIDKFFALKEKELMED